RYGSGSAPCGPVSPRKLTVSSAGLSPDDSRGFASSASSSLGGKDTFGFVRKRTASAAGSPNPPTGARSAEWRSSRGTALKKPKLYGSSNTSSATSERGVVARGSAGGSSRVDADTPLTRAVSTRLSVPIGQAPAFAVASARPAT